MSVKYIATDISRQDLTGTYQPQDLEIIDKLRVNSLFNPNKHFIEVNYYIENALFFNEKDYRRFSILTDSEFAGKEGTSRIVINPVEDVKTLEYVVPEVRIEYKYYNDLFSKGREKVEFFIESISEDRTELRLQSLTASPTALLEKINSIQQRLTTSSTFVDFKILVEEDTEQVALNIDFQEENNKFFTLVKLYNPLPENILEKSKVRIAENISDDNVFLVQADIEVIPEPGKRISEPNFNVEAEQESNILSDYYNLDTLLSLDAGYNADFLEVLSRSNSKSIELNIDYTDYSNYINYSSALERFNNFVYKVELIQSYETSLGQLSTNTATALSRKKLQSLIEGIVRNFDHYEKFLYFEKTDQGWPKIGDNKPYTLLDKTDPAVINWLASNRLAAEIYDNTNTNALTNTIPAYLREDPHNDPYITFIQMIGQHFDNLWIYSKAVSNKYNADNRLNRGISKDLIEEVLKNFGIKLYSDLNSSADLFKYFTIGGYDPGEEIINTFVTGSLETLSTKDYVKETYKRIYHNLPLLLKSKGTERGVKTLIACFGIPSETLKVKQYGGINRTELPYFGQKSFTTASLDKIRIDNTGSIQGQTVSYYTDITQSPEVYTADLHRIEVGFSPTDNINNYILSQINPLFNIDEYLGNPTGKGYKELEKVARGILSNLDRYDLKDFIRLIKFFDNRLFKMVKDFTPARTVTDSGIIIKPHLLEKSVYDKLAITSFEEVTTGSIETAFIEGIDAGSFGAKGDYITSWTETIQTPDGKVLKPTGQFIGRTDGETPKYTGEFSGSVLEVATGELNEDNLFKKQRYQLITYDIFPVINTIPTISPTPTPTPTLTPTPTSVTPTPTPTPTLTPTATPIPLFNIYVNTSPVTLSGGIYLQGGVDIKTSPGIGGELLQTTVEWIGDGSNQQGATIYKDGTPFNGSNELYIAFETQFNTHTQNDWVALQIDDNGVVTGVKDSSGNDF